MIETRRSWLSTWPSRLCCSKTGPVIAEHFIDLLREIIPYIPSFLAGDAERGTAGNRSSGHFGRRRGATVPVFFRNRTILDFHGVARRSCIRKNSGGYTFFQLFWPGFIPVWPIPEKVKEIYLTCPARFSFFPALCLSVRRTIRKLLITTQKSVTLTYT